MTVERDGRGRTRLVAWAINLAGVLVFAVILYLGGLDVWRQIFSGDPVYVLAALGANLLWNLVAAYRWYLIADSVTEGQPGCPYRFYYVYHMIGMVTGQIVPIGVGMLGGRPMALSLSGTVSLRRAALSVVLDKFFDLILAVLLAVPVALYLIDWIDLPLAGVLLAAAVLLGLMLIGWQYERAMRWLARVAFRVSQPLARLPLIGRRLISRLPQQFERLSTETFVTNRRAMLLFGLTLVLYSLLALRLVLIAMTLHLDVPWYVLAMGVSVTQLTLIFSFTPGSLGVLEGGWWAVFSLAGQARAVYTVFVIARRAFVLVFTLVCAVLGFIWVRQSPARLFRAVFSASGQPAPAEAPPAEPPAAKG